MTTLLIALTVVEILALVLVLALYVNAVIARLRSVADTLAKVAFGVRAVEVQVASLGPSLDRINGVATRIADQALPSVARKAEQRAG